MVAIPQVQMPDFAGTLMRGEAFQQSRLQALAQQQAMEDSRQARQVASEVLPQIGTLQGPALIGQLGRLVGADPRFAAFAAPLIQRERDNTELGLGGGAPAAAPVAMPAAAGARPVTPATAPAELMPLIEEASRETGIPIPVLVAKIRQESNFDPNARGRAGEIGLAQIMPATAQRPGFGVQPVDPARLAADPRENVLFGARYLAARGRAAGVTDWNDPAQVDRALAAYNGGGDPNYVQNVRRWMPGSTPAPAGGDTIPAQAAAPGGAPGIQRTPDGHIVVPGQNMSMVSRAYAAPPGNERAREIIQRYEAALTRHLQVMNMERREGASEPLETVLDPATGQPVLVPRSQAAGRQPVRTPPVQVNNMPGETSFDRERGKALAEQVADWNAAATRAGQTAGRLARLEGFNRQFTTGAFANTTLTAGQIAGRLGIPDSVLSAVGLSRDQVAAGEGIRSITAQLLQGMLGPGGFPTQNFSNTDREMLERALPSLVNSPRGNEVIIAALRLSVERDRAVGRAWRDWVRQNGESADSVRRFEAERLPAIVDPDVLRPLIEDAMPVNDQGAAPGGAAIPPPPPGFRPIQR